MVAAVRAGKSLRTVARQFGMSLLTVQRWVERAGRRRLDRVDWADRSHRPQRQTRTAPEVEHLVLTLRRELREESVLGEFGAPAIRQVLVQRGYAAVPAERTIGRILVRSGALDGRRRVRRPPPPPGWYLPELAAGAVELDSFDVIEGLMIAGGIDVEVLTGVSLHGGLPAAWPGRPLRATTVVDALVAHWQEHGLPAYAQFDNDTRFQGAHQFPDTLGRVTRLCCSLGVVPVFVPPREPGFQAAVESYNAQWQAKVWQRFHHPTRHRLRERSNRYVAALRARRASRIHAAPPRRAFPRRWLLDLQIRPTGRMVFLRRGDEEGVVEFLGHRWLINRQWAHRLVRAEVDFEGHAIACYGLRRQAPAQQPLLRRVRYRYPRDGFAG
jgi:hypothetical protein